MFPSKISMGRKLNDARELGPEDYILEYDGNMWFVGDLAEEGSVPISNTQGTKVNHETLLLTLTATGKMGVGLRYTQPVHIVTGVPVDQYTEEERKGLKDLLHESRTIEFTSNGQKHRVEVAKVTVTLEAGAAFYCNPRVGTVRVVDVGGRTFNFCTFINKKFRDKGSGTLQEGWNTLQVPEEKKPEEAARIIESYTGKTWDRNDLVMLVGGRAKKLEPAIQKIYPNAYAVQDPSFANVKGYRTLGELQRREVG